MSAITSFVEVITTNLPTLVGGFGKAIADSIGAIFLGAEGALTDAGFMLALGVVMGCSIGLVRMAWNFFANIGHR